MAFKAKYGIINQRNVAHVIDVIFCFFTALNFWLNFFRKTSLETNLRFHLWAANCLNFLASFPFFYDLFLWILFCFAHYNNLVRCARLMDWNATDSKCSDLSYASSNVRQSFCYRCKRSIISLCVCSCKCKLLFIKYIAVKRWNANER